jgi:hypothetical protein
LPPAPELRRRLFTESSTTVILTSATLRTGGRFANVERMLGVPEEHEAVVAPSPLETDGATVVHYDEITLIVPEGLSAGQYWIQAINAGLASLNGPDGPWLNVL